MNIRNEVIRIINELLNLSKKITDLPQAYALDGTEAVEVVQAGISKQAHISDFPTGGGSGTNKFRGNYDASTNVFPSTLGSGIAGLIMAGDEWVISVSNTSGLDGGIWPVGTILKSLVDAPGQTVTNWRIY